MEFDSYKNYLNENVSDSQFLQLLSQCGLRAMVVLNSFYSIGPVKDLYGNDRWDISKEGVMRSIIRKVRPNDLREIILKGEMDYKDILIIMKQIQPEKYPDFRFSNPISRDVKGTLFFNNLCGLTALKFEETNASHWAVLFHGCVYPLIEDENRPTRKSYTAIEEMRKDIKGFDGFGHTIIYRTKEDIDILKRQCLGQYCDKCIREDWCEFKKEREALLRLG